jgi:hypothetical protein
VTHQSPDDATRGIPHKNRELFLVRFAQHRAVELE